MPVEVALWRLDEELRRIEYSAIESETRLEQVLADDISVLDPSLFLIGRQVPTAHGKYIDLLALDADANVVVIELIFSDQSHTAASDELGSRICTSKTTSCAIGPDHFSNAQSPGATGQVWV